MDAETFSLRLPLPYRLACLIVGGIWLWGLALQLVKPLPRLIGHPHNQHGHCSLPFVHSTYTFASFLTGPLVLSILFYAAVATQENAPSWRFLPNSTLLLVVLAFVPLLIPRIPLPRAGRTRFLLTFKRIAIGGVAKQEDLRFGDVLLADALTSYARPFSELYVAFCLFLPHQHTQHDVELHYWGTVIIPVLAGYPFFVRAVQCYHCRQPANFVKYCTAFPPIILGALCSHPGFLAIDQDALRHCWTIFQVINSTYSLWWDIFKDWDLWLLSSVPSSVTNPQKDRVQQTKVFGVAPRYFVFVFLDAILRFTWTTRLHQQMDIYQFHERTIFVLEILEVLRRFIWLVWRAETEFLRKRGENIELSMQTS